MSTPHALVIGGGSGIGAAVVIRHRQAGTPVTVWDIAGEVDVRCDVSQPHEIDTAIDAHLAEHGVPRWVTITAGVGHSGLLVDTTPEDWDRVMRINVRGPWLCMRGLALPMKEQGQPGSIIATSSVSAHLVDRNMGPYCASKAALSMTIKVAAAEWGPFGIRVNGIGPGVTKTPMLGAPEGSPWLVGVAQRSALQRLGEADDIAQAVLALHQMEWVTGQVLDCDGGLSLHSPIDSYGAHFAVATLKQPDATVLRAYAPEPSHYRSSQAPAWLDELDLSVSEQHLRMGARSLPVEQWLLPDTHAPRELALRRRLLTEQRPLVFACNPVALEAAGEVAELIEQVVGKLGDDDHPLVRAGGSIQEDLCLMVQHDGAWHLEGAVLCFPSLWVLSEKLGRPLSAVHEPVAGYAEELAGRVDTFFDRLPSNRLVWRRNFSIWPDLWLWAPWTSFDRMDGEPTELWIRSERQTLRRLPISGAILFTIRVQVAPMTVLINRPDVAGNLALWLDSPAGAERRRQLGPASERLLPWLRETASPS